MSQNAPNFCRTQLNDRGNDFDFFNARTAGVDCNVATTSACVELVKGTQLTSKQCRDIANWPDGGTSTEFASDVFKDQGMAPGIDFVRFSHVDVQRVRDLSRTGWYVVGFVDYGVINDLAPHLSGARTYRGGHAIGLCGWWRSGSRYTWDFDPTFDGRTRWVAGEKVVYPFGRQRAKFSIIRKAMEESAGANRASGYAVKPR